MTEIDQIISKLSLEEKVSLLSGFNSWYTNKIAHANIPSIKMSDGPNGIRGDSNSGKSSACFPCAISIGSTWDLELINQLEKYIQDKHLLLSLILIVFTALLLYRLFYQLIKKR